MIRRAGVELSPGSSFGPRSAGFVRLNFATSADVLEVILDRVAGALVEHRRPGRATSHATTLKVAKMWSSASKSASVVACSRISAVYEASAGWATSTTSDVAVPAHASQTW